MSIPLVMSNQTALGPYEILDSYVTSSVPFGEAIKVGLEAKNKINNQTKKKKKNKTKEGECERITLESNA